MICDVENEIGQRRPYTLPASAPPEAREAARRAVRARAPSVSMAPRPSPITRVTTIDRELAKKRATFPNATDKAELDHMWFIWTNPRGFGNAYIETWRAIATDQGKVEYATMIQNWVRKNIPPGEWSRLLSKMTLPHLIHFVNTVTPEHSEFMNAIYIQRDLPGYVRGQTINNEAISDPMAKESHKELVLTYLDKFGGEWQGKVPEDVKERFALTFFPEEIQRAAVAAMDAAKNKRIAQIIGIGGLGAFGLWAMGAIGKKRR